MYLSERVLGSYVANQIRTRTAAPLLRIGRDVFHRADLARVACFNFQAAANLSAILNRELQVEDTADVFHHITPEFLALPRLGSVAIAVLGAAFETKGLGGDAPLDAWVRKHQTHKDAEIVTFASLKHRDEADRAAERKDLKARKAARRSQAHRLRAERFIKRHGETG